MINKFSPEWAEIREHLESRLQKLREKNDRPSNAENTAFLRGSIQEIKELLKLPDKEEEVIAQPVDYDHGL